MTAEFVHPPKRSQLVPAAPQKSNVHPIQLKAEHPAIQIRRIHARPCLIQKNTMVLDALAKGFETASRTRLNLLSFLKTPPKRWAAAR
ncbi:hypothetical protein [uncultured Roseobacter sp.]|uniref:hypothetical protein n=1 Tax=uncultured Roseobacter sp. TaxID=114847 RepID=UPI00261D74E1|nr:hypothetical protein [uncultured Roseobacter sp.]